METYIIHKTNGTMKTVKQNKPMTLKQLQKLVGGYVEIIPMGEVGFACNEDGYSLNLLGNPYFPGFVGDVVIGQSRNGVFHGVPKSYIDDQYYIQVRRKHVPKAS